MGLSEECEKNFSWIGVALNPMTLSLEDTEGETQTHRRSQVEMGAETGGMPPQAQGRLEPPDAGGDAHFISRQSSTSVLKMKVTQCKG